MLRAPKMRLSQRISQQVFSTKMYSLGYLMVQLVSFMPLGLMGMYFKPIQKEDFEWFHDVTTVSSVQSSSIDLPPMNHRTLIFLISSIPVLLFTLVVIVYQCCRKKRRRQRAQMQSRPIEAPQRPPSEGPPAYELIMMEFDKLPRYSEIVRSQSPKDFKEAVGKEEKCASEPKQHWKVLPDTSTEQCQTAESKVCSTPTSEVLPEVLPQMQYLQSPSLLLTPSASQHHHQQLQNENSNSIESNSESACCKESSSSPQTEHSEKPPSTSLTTLALSPSFIMHI